MINNILFIALVVLAVTEVIFICSIFSLKDKVKELSLDNDVFKMILKDNNEMVEKLCNLSDKQTESYETMYKLVDLITDQYTTIKKQYDIFQEQNVMMLKSHKMIIDNYQTIDKNYSMLLKVWREKYDHTYEQFKFCLDEMKRVREVLEPWVLDADQLGQEYVDGINFTYIPEEDDPDNPFVESENYKKIKPIQPEDYVNSEKIDEMTLSESAKKGKEPAA